MCLTDLKNFSKYLLLLIENIFALVDNYEHAVVQF